MPLAPDMNIPWDPGLFRCGQVKAVEYMKFYEIMSLCVCVSAKLRDFGFLKITRMARLFLKVYKESHILNGMCPCD